jgi:pilus assembly protein CpaF
MVAMAGYDLPISVVRRYIASAINIVVHLSRLKGGVRRVMRVSEIVDLEDNEYQMREIFRFQQAGLDAEGRARGSFYAAGNVPSISQRLAERGIVLDPKLFVARTLRSPMVDIGGRSRANISTASDTPGDVGPNEEKTP